MANGETRFRRDLFEVENARIDSQPFEVADCVWIGHFSRIPSRTPARTQELSKRYFDLTSRELPTIVMSRLRWYLMARDRH